jgi:DNA-binding CsgD family transcriptional regulator
LGIESISVSPSAVTAGVRKPIDKRPSGAREALLQAVEAVPGNDLAGSLGEVARRLPVPTSAELIAIRLRDTDGERLFHLVAMEGASPRERRARALNPLSLAAVKSQAALGRDHTVSQALGLRSLHAAWIRIGDEPGGVVFAATRTDRHMTDPGRRLVTDVCARLGERLHALERTRSVLMDTSLRIAREAALVPEASGGELDTLRPRERTIVVLYAEGLAVDEIARLLVISPHTVRTHVKNAFRRLGVHSRDEAARLVFADDVRRLL